MMDNIVLSYEKPDAGDYLTVVNTNEFQEKKDPKPNPHIYFTFNTRDQIYSYEREIPQRNFPSDVSGGIKEPSHLTERAGPSHNFGLTRDDLPINRMTSANITQISEQRDSLRSTSTTYDRIGHISPEVDIDRNRTEIRNLKPSRCSLVRIFGVFTVLVLLAVGVALIYLFVNKKDSSQGHDKVPVFFTETSVTREIGSNFNFTCVLEGKFSSSGAIISRNSSPNGAETLCNVSDTGLVTCISARISGIAWPDENNLTTTLTIDSVNCEDEGSYFCGSVSHNSLQASMNFSVTKPPEGKPLLTIPARMVVDMKEYDKTINCSANVGYPAGDLQIQYSNDHFVTYKKLDIGIAEATTEENKGCSVTKGIVYKQYTYTQSWNNTDIRCVVYYPYNAVTPFKTSDIQTITLISIYFTETSVSREIGSNFNFTCILEGNSSSSGAIIYRNSRPNEAETLCNVSDTGLVTCGSERISGSAWPNENNLTTTFTIVSVKCEDEGAYFCRSVSNNSLQTSMNLSVTKPPEGKPLLTIPARMVLELTEYDKKINCSANVGYPAGDLQIQYSNDNFVTYKNIDIGIADVVTSGKEGCSVTKTITYRQYKYTQSWNNTKIRCVVYYPSGEATPSIPSEIQVITLVKDECPPKGDWYYYHPLNCHYSITCSQGYITIVDHCGNKCPDVTSNRSAPHCTGDCSRC